jgi:hypothetical protein
VSAALNIKGKLVGVGERQNVGESAPVPGAICLAFAIRAVFDIAA